MQPLDLLKTAWDLVKASNSRPRQANLLRATSTIYYAVFHTLARCSADVLIGGTGAERSGRAWNQVYRALEHSAAKKRCQNSDIISKFPAEIQDFANLFAAMQSKRHLADYDPATKLDKSTVVTDLLAAEKVIEDFLAAPIKDRRTFSAYVLFKTRT